MYGLSKTDYHHLLRSLNHALLHENVDHILGIEESLTYTIELSVTTELCEECSFDASSGNCR